jgi:hypothetical protein
MDKKRDVLHIYYKYYNKQKTSTSYDCYNMYLTYAHICKNHILDFMALSLLNFKITIAHGFITCTT